MRKRGTPNAGDEPTSKKRRKKLKEGLETHWTNQHQTKKKN
jgi:hypothetical protein